MPHVMKVALAGTIWMLAGLLGPASAHGRLFPLTRCGPDLAYLCPLHGYFTGAPFHYNVAIYPGCIKTVAVETPSGLAHRKMVVCGAPDREMIWWW
jgi:hypothetical protein